MPLIFTAPQKKISAHWSKWKLFPSVRSRKVQFLLRCLICSPWVRLLWVNSPVEIKLSPNGNQWWKFISHYPTQGRMCTLSPGPRDVFLFYLKQHHPVYFNPFSLCCKLMITHGWIWYLELLFLGIQLPLVLDHLFNQTQNLA